jgi:hypothetical protein
MTAAVTGLAGAVCVRHVTDRRQLLLAATPLCFAVQQAIEGGLWVLLPHGSTAATSALTYAFLFVAQVFWPLYSPAAALSCEPSPYRRRVMGVCLALGLGLAAWMVRGLATEPHRAVLACNHVVYDLAQNSSSALIEGALYLCAVVLPLMASSFPSMRALGIVVLVGSVISYAFYFAAFQSVWCYFAATASVVILGHFHRQKAGCLDHPLGAPA